MVQLDEFLQKPFLKEDQIESMCGHYPIIEVESDWTTNKEDLGSKTKFWYTEPDETVHWLFKYPRDNTGEHWAEKIASELSECLDIEHANVELAQFERKRGSVSESFANEDHELIHGNQLLEWVVQGYHPERKFGQSGHTLDNIWQVMDYVFLDSEGVDRAKSQFSEYVILDALVANTDRHHENWGLIRKYENDSWRDSIAPSFDHASSLGRELPDPHRDRLLMENEVGKYVEKGRGAIFWREDDRHGPSPLELARLAIESYPKYFYPALAKLDGLNKNLIAELVNRVNDEWMSHSAKKFAITLMHYTLEQLRELNR